MHGLTESITRAHGATIEQLIFEAISLDYQHTIMAAAGSRAMRRCTNDAQNHGKYLLAVDGSIPLGNPGYSTMSGISNVDMLRQAAEGAMAIVAIGSCAAFGGIPKANPNPTGAVAVPDIIKDKPIVNVTGCPPIPVVVTGVLAQIRPSAWRAWSSITSAGRRPSSARASTIAAIAGPSTTRPVR